MIKIPTPHVVEFRALLMDRERESTKMVSYQVLDMEVVTGAQLQTAAATWGADVAALSNAVLVEVSATIRDIDTFVVPGTQTIYGNAEDKLYIEFRSQETGQIYACSVPVPLTTDFLGDTETINPADTNVAALLTFITGSCTSKQGGATLQFIRGRRQRGRGRKEGTGVPTAIG